jgi:hypothetical protein
LFSVPRTVRPRGSAVVRSSGWPAAGPVRRIRVRAVIRRLNRRRPDSRQAPDLPTRSISTTDMPWAIIAIRRCAGVVSAGDVTPGNISCSSVYSWLTTSSARSPLPGSGMTVT